MRQTQRVENISHKAPANTTDIYYGCFMHTPTTNRVEVMQNSLIEVDALGTIKSTLHHGDPRFEEALGSARSAGNITEFGPNEILIPGMVDLHVHAPQWPQLGKALHLPLEDWLQKYTFPLEARYSDIAFAQQVYPSLVKALLANGTTTAMYFATIHEEATALLAQTCLSIGQRAYVGRVAMDDPTQCPDYYRDKNATLSLQSSERSLKYIRSLDFNQHELVKPVITPRFIPSCSNELLEGLGELAKKHQCHVQTHCSESDWEHHYVLDRLGMTDTQALANFGLLSRHTVLAHSNFVNDADMQIITEYGSGIAHCPLSNGYFANSVFPLREALNKSVRVGLGTDIAGGHSASIFNACQNAVLSSRQLESGVDVSVEPDKRAKPETRINFIEAFYLATVGGAEVLNSPTGLFQTGLQFDALQLDLDHPQNRLNEFTEACDWEELMGQIVHNTQPCNIKNVWVSGNNVHHT